MVKGIIFIFLCSVYLIGSDLKVSLEALSVGNIDITLNQKELINKDGSLKVDSMIAVLQSYGKYDVSYFSKERIKLKFIPSSEVNNIIFVKSIDAAVAGFSNDILLSTLSSNPLEYGLDIAMPRDSSLIGLDSNLTSYGLHITGFKREADTLDIYLDASNSTLPATFLKLDTQMPLGNIGIVQIDNEAEVLTLFSRSLKMGTLNLYIYDKDLNNLLVINKPYDKKSISVDLPSGAVYALVGDERGILRSALVLLAQKKQIQEEDE